MLEKLETVLSHRSEASGANKKAQLFINLKDDSSFSRFGTGFLVSLLGEENLEQSIYVRVEGDAQNVSKLRFEYGNTANKETIRIIEYIRNVISKGSFDLRLETFGIARDTLDLN